MIYFNEIISRSAVLAEWEELLLLHTDLQQKDIRRTEFTLTFTYEDIPFDIAAVRNSATLQVGRIHDMKINDPKGDN